MPTSQPPFPVEPALAKVLVKDKAALESTALPIVTVAGTFKEDIKGFYGLPENENLPDIVLSRAHYSMPVGVAISVWGSKVDQRQAWLVDPTTYVTPKDWFSVSFTHTVGKTIARYPLLKTLKDIVDKFGRQKLPILTSITPPLQYLTEKVSQPILSFHIAAGNILVEQGKRVIQVVTDPHVRDEYVSLADKPNLSWCVFDAKTKLELLEKALIRGYKVDPNRVIVTGPPIDPRIVAARMLKHAWHGQLDLEPKARPTSRPLRLCLSTGGLGTNKPEIKQILEEVLPLLKQRRLNLQLLVYAGTQPDIAEMVKRLARQARVKINKLDDAHGSLRLIYHPQLVDANEQLIKYAFPWADGFITKPSGDMAYDAAAAGCFLLTLQEWGEWEHQVRAVFEGLGIAQRADAANFVTQLRILTKPIAVSPHAKPEAWVTQAMDAALDLPSLFLNGSKNIIKVIRKLP